MDRLQERLQKEWVRQLMHPVETGVEKNPTIVNVLMALKTKVKVAMMLDFPNAHDCTICNETLNIRAQEPLIELSCGHIFHRDCAIEKLIAHHQFQGPALHVFNDVLWVPMPDDRPFNPQTVDIWVDHERRRDCPTCSRIIIPDQGVYDWTNYEVGIAPEEAELILEWFRDPQLGQDRMARLNDDQTIGPTLREAQGWAAERYHHQYLDNVAAEQEEHETARFLAGDSDYADDDADDDYVP